MDVICEHCRTEYEFDETLLSDRGTTVKCTTCGHTFRLFPSRASSVIRVRRQDGTLQTYSAITEVRALIERGQISEDDEISENGGNWIAMSEVPELAVLFSKGRTKRARRITPQGYVTTPQKATLLGVGRQPQVSNIPSQQPVPSVVHAPAPVAAQIETTRVSVPNPTARSPQTLSGYNGPPTPTPITTPYIPPEVTRPVVPHVVLSENPAPRPSFTPPSTPPPAQVRKPRPKERANLYLDEGHERAAAQSKGLGIGGTIVLVVMAAGLGAGGFYFYQQWKQQQTRAPLEASAMLVAEGDRQADDDTPDAYRVAVGTFDRVHQRYPDHWAPLAALARTHAYWAQTLLFEAKDASASPVEAEVRRADTLRELARQHATEASRYADRARSLAPHDVHVLVAAADAARLMEHLPEAQIYLDEAMGERTGMSGHPHYVKALLALGPNLDNAAGALADAERAVALEPDRAAYRLLLARIQIIRGELVRARAAVDLVIATNPTNPAARALIRTLEARATPDAGVPDETGDRRRRRTDDSNATPADLP